MSGGFFREIVDPFGMGSGIISGIAETVTEGLSGAKEEPKAPIEPKQNEADKLEMEAEESRKRKQLALEELNPTGTTGAGTPQTARKQLLGV
jgi:hypothetical protein